MKLEPKALLFDMDGVLVDSLDSWWKALNASLENFNKPTLSKKEFIEKFWGRDLRYNLKRLNLDPEIVGFCNNIYDEHIGAVKIYPDTKKTLKKLDGYKKGLITNTPKGCAMQILKKTSLKDFFDVIMTSDDVKEGKPSPEIVVKACEALDVEPSNVLLIGDTDSDVKAGHQAGCRVIGINVEADYTVDSIGEVSKLIKS